MRLRTLALLVCALAAVSTTQAEEPPAAQKAVEIRQSILKLLGWNFSTTSGPMMASNRKFDALVPMIPDAFALDTRHTSGLKTRARAAIWINMADFKAKDADLVKAAAALSSIARSGDEATFEPAALAVSQACRACHDAYREE